MWLTLGIIVIVAAVLLAFWLLWSLMRRASTDSSGVEEEYAEYVRQQSERSSPESPAEQQPDQRPT